MEKLKGIVSSWELGCPRLCVAAGLIGVKEGRGVFIVRYEKVLQKTGYCSARARLGICPFQNVTDTNEEPIRKKHNKVEDWDEVSIWICCKR